jgi:arsenate reductase (thioredoxin)
MMCVMGKRSILFLRTGNSWRGHMAEGWLRHLAGDRFESFSAGAGAAGFVHPLALRSMAEAGANLSGQRPKSPDEFAGREFDLLITVCDDARGAYPVFAGAKRRRRRGLDEPVRATGSDEEKIAVFRRVRGVIGSRIRQLLAHSNPGMMG